MGNTFGGLALNEELRKLREEVEKLRQKIEEIEKLKQEIKVLKNHISHPPLISKILDHIREVKIITIPELRKKFPTLYGSNLSDLYQAVRSSDEFTLIEGKAQWYPTIIAHTPNKTPITVEEMAVDYYKSIPPLRWETRVAPNGRRYRKPVGKAGSIEGIMEKYKISREHAEQVMTIIITVFGRRVWPDEKYQTFLRRF